MLIIKTPFLFKTGVNKMEAGRRRGGVFEQRLSHR